MLLLFIWLSPIISLPCWFLCFRKLKWWVLVIYLCLYNWFLNNLTKVNYFSIVGLFLAHNIVESQVLEYYLPFAVLFLWSKVFQVLTQDAGAFFLLLFQTLRKWCPLIPLSITRTASPLWPWAKWGGNFISLNQYFSNFFKYYTL